MTLSSTHNFVGRIYPVRYPRSYHIPTNYQGGDTNDTEAFSCSDVDSEGTGDHQDVLGASQLGGAPLFPTQEVTQIPPVQPRPERVQRSPDRYTYPTDHVYAQQRARQRGRRGG